MKGLTSRFEEAPPTYSVLTPGDISIMHRRNPDGSLTTNTTGTVYGGQVALVRYTDPIRLSPFSKRKDYKKQKITKRKESNISRTKRNVLRIIMQNWPDRPDNYTNMPVWATFTYPDGNYAKITNRASHIRDIEKFHRLLRRKYGSNLKSIAVMELTKLNNVHWHVLLFNLPKYDSPKTIANIWVDMMYGKGVVCHPSAQEIKRVPYGYRNARTSAKKLAEYLSKYLVKTFEEHDYSHTKLYLPSKGLRQPERLHGEDLYRYLETHVGALFKTYESPVHTLPYVGDIRVQIYEPYT